MAWVEIILLLILLLGIGGPRYLMFPLNKRRPGQIHPGYGINALGYIWLAALGIGILILIGQMITEL
jgi:hypothetical protein